MSIDNRMFNNAGWVRGTKSAEGKWGAFIWTMQNQITFRSSETDRWSFAGGMVTITNVIVGSLGNYPPMNIIADTGPNLDAAYNTYPGDNQGDEGNYGVDLTTFYQLALPEIAVTPKEAVAAVGGSVVQFTATGTNIPSGVTWMLDPEGEPDGAILTPSGNTADVAPGNVPMIYRIIAASVDCPNLYDEANLTVVRVVIDNYTTVTYDGLNSGSLICRVEPEGVTPSSYAWSATWPTPAYNDPQVTFESPSGESTRIMNAHWYSTTPSPGTKAAVFYDIYCTVQFNGMSCSNTTPASFCVGVYEEGGHTDPPDHTGNISYDYTTTNGYFMVTSVVGWERIAPVVSNAYTPNSQFYPKVQAHEEKHESDFNNGYEGHMFYQKVEFEALVIGLTNSTLEGLDTMVSEERYWFLEEEDGEIFNVHDEMEDRAYQVSDAIPPSYIYQRGGI